MASGQAAYSSSTRENTNYFRLCRLLIDMGTEALRNLFNGIHPPANLHKIFLRSSLHYTTLQWLRNIKVLNFTQWGKLATLSSAKFDISLLVVLLRNVCGLSPPVSTGNWDELPPDSDNSTEANIVRIKHFRNDVYAHASKASVEDSTFNKLWKNISNAIIGLASEEDVPSYVTAIGNMKDECVDPDREAYFRNFINSWKKYDDDTKKILEELKENQKRTHMELGVMKENLERTDYELKEVKENLKRTHIELGVMKENLERTDYELKEVKENRKRTYIELGETKEMDDQEENGKAYINHVRYFQSQCGYQKALPEHHAKRLKIPIGADDLDGQRRTYGNIPSANESLAKYRKAIEYHEKHLKIATETGDRVGEGRAYENLGIAHRSLSNYQKAIEYHEKHLKIARETGDRVGEGRAYENLGIAHQSLSNYQKAIEYHEKHLKIAQEINDRIGEGRACGNLGTAYQSLGDS